MLFSNAIQKDMIITIESEKLNSIKNNKLKNIQDKIPMNISRICTILQEEIGYIEFIEVMSNAKITKV